MVLRGRKMRGPLNKFAWFDYIVKALIYDESVYLDWMNLLYFSFLLLFWYLLPKFSSSMTMVTLPNMKIEPLVSFLPLQEFLRCLDWYWGIMASWMIVKIHFRSCQILLTNDSTSYAVRIKMETFLWVYLASSL